MPAWRCHRPAEIAGVLVQIRVRPGPRQCLGRIGAKDAAGRAIRIGIVLHVHGIGRQHTVIGHGRSAAYSIDGVSYVAVPDEDHLWVFVRRVRVDKIAKISGAETGPVCCHGCNGARRSVHGLVGGAIANLGRAQLVGHDTKHIGHPISSRMRAGTDPVDDVLHRAPFGRADLRGIFVAVVAFPHLEGQTDLFHIGNALRSSRGCLGLGKRRQQQGSKDGNDGNHYQEFNEREGF